MKKRFVIKGKLDGLNDYTKACRSNRMAGAQMKTKNERIITAYIWQQLRGVKFKGRVALLFHWYEPNRKRDMDNIAFAKKFILDALVENSVIQSDGWRGVAGFSDLFEIDKDNPRIEVEIIEAEEEVENV